MTIRPITVADIPAFRSTLDSVARERRHLFLLEAPPLEAMEKSIRGDLESGEVIRLVAIVGEEVAGWCDVVLRQEGGTRTGRLGMGVRAEFRRQGIGGGLLAAAMEEAWACGAGRIQLEVFRSNHAAMRLYRKFEFREEGVRARGRHVDGVWEDVVIMAKNSTATGRA